MSSPGLGDPCAAVGVSDHAGWAVLVVASPEGVLLDRRRVVLVDDGLPAMPHHHDAQYLPVDEGVALVERVRENALQNARLGLAALAEDVPEVRAIALRACPALPDTVAGCIADYRAMCVADWVMYRQVLAAAAVERGWRVAWYETASVTAEAAATLGLGSLDPMLAAAKRQAGAPWQKDHRLAMAAAVVAANAAR